MGGRFHNNNQKKCKFTNDAHTKGKKSKSTSRPLSKEDYERAKKENLCFVCLGKHNKKDCPQVQKARPSQSKQMHMVQVLPLELSPRYSSVEVLHVDVQHECQLTPSMWQPSFGPHELVRMHGSIQGHKVRILIDDGASHNFLNYKLVKKLKLQQTKSTHVYKVDMMSAHDSEVWDTFVAGVALDVQGHTMTLSFHVMNMDRADVVLGREWLHSLGPSLKRSYEHNSLMFDVNGKHVLLLGEKHIPPSPLICMAELTSKSDEVKEVFLCYSLCHLLSTDSFDVCHNECDAINDYVNQSNVIATTSTFFSTCNVLRDKNDLNIDNEELALNATSLVKGKLEGDKNVTNIFTNAHLTKMKHQPLIQELSNQNNSRNSLII